MFSSIHEYSYNDISVDDLSVDLDEICSPEYMVTHIIIFQLMS